MDTEATAAGDDDGVPRPIGQVLAAARATRGLDLGDVARETRVPVRHLAAIEADAHDGLPALPYAIGFVKAFARVVGVDPDMAGARFRAETSKLAHVPVAPAMTPLDERRLPPRGLVLASLAAVIVAVGGIAAWSAGAFDGAPPVVAGTPVAVAPSPSVVGPGVATPPAAVAAISPGVPPATTPRQPAAAPPSTAAAAPQAVAAGAPVAAPAAPSSGVVITASDDAWFKVSVYDPAVGKVVTVKTGVLAKGERYAPPPTPGLRLWTGRAGALAITVDGRPIPPLGGPVETVKNVSLDASDLRARLAGPVPVMASVHKGG